MARASQGAAHQYLEGEIEGLQHVLEPDRSIVGIIKSGPGGGSCVAFDLTLVRLGPGCVELARS